MGADDRADPANDWSVGSDHRREHVEELVDVSSVALHDRQLLDVAILLRLGHLAGQVLQ
jgi:hypothetical protein